MKHIPVLMLLILGLLVPSVAHTQSKKLQDVVACIRSSQTLTWRIVPNVKYYYVYADKDPRKLRGKLKKPEAIIAHPDNRYVIRDTLKTNLYYYTVVSVDHEGRESIPSEIVSCSLQ